MAIPKLSDDTIRIMLWICDEITSDHEPGRGPCTGCFPVAGLDSTPWSRCPAVDARRLKNELLDYERTLMLMEGKS